MIWTGICSQRLTQISQLLRHFDITIADPYKQWTSICYEVVVQRDLNR